MVAAVLRRPRRRQQRRRRRQRRRSSSSDVALERAQRLPLASRPGTAWCYSDLGLILAGRIVEQVTALGLADAFRRLVAEPLGLAARYGPVPGGAGGGQRGQRRLRVRHDRHRPPVPGAVHRGPVPRLAEPPAARGGQRRQRRPRARRRRGSRRPVRHGGRPAAAGRRRARRRLHPGAGPRPLRRRRRRPSRAGGRLPPGPRPARRRRPHRAVPRRLYRHLFRLRARGRLRRRRRRDAPVRHPRADCGRRPAADVSQLVAGADIQSVLLEAALRACAQASIHATTAEEL